MGDSVPAVLALLAKNNISVQWRDGRPIFKAEAAPSADIVSLIEAQKAGISAFLHPDAVRDRLEAAAAVMRAVPPPDVSDAHWDTAMRGLEAFLANGHADEALGLDWPKGELFSIPPLWARVDLCGAGLLIGDREAVGITPNEIRIKTPSGATLAFYRKPEVDYGLAYRNRIKMVGEDATKEEFQLRALEAVVNLYRANHPGADIDAAKTAVLAAIKEAAP